jgi:methyl-accepting chemotaxis protein
METAHFRSAEGELVLSTVADQESQVEARLREVNDQIGASRKAYEKLISSDQERDIYQKFSERWNAYTAMHSKLLDLSRLHKGEEATALFRGKMQEEFDAATKMLAALTGIDKSRSLAAYKTSQSTYDAVQLETGLAIGFAFLVGLACLGYVVAGVTGPMRKITAAMKLIADGTLTAEIPSSGSKNELGEIAQTVDIFKRNMLRVRELAEEKERDQALKDRQQAELISFIQGFEGTVLGVLDGLTHAEQMLRDTSVGVDRTAANVKEKAGSAGRSVDGASQNVQTMASTAEELTSSIQEIARQVAEASTVAVEAVSETDTAATEIRALEETVTEIGEIVGLINSIASQTNLLALNATIEAARAGDAGKGFAVVANEVKSLATQTAKATGDIASQIEQVQAATASAVSAMSRIGAVIHSINEISAGIASAVEEQSSATGEIARSADHAAGSTQNVALLMTDLNQAAEESGISAAEIASSSAELSKQSATLKEEVRAFLNRVRSGDGNPDEAELVSWDENFSFGIPAIDTEHRHLMELTNALYREVKAGREGGTLKDIFQRLRTYTTRHFTEEDNQMARLGYPQAEEHSRHHDAFIRRLDGLFESYQQGSTGAGMDLTALLGSWWRTHIGSDDSALAAFVRTRKA